MPLKFDQGDTLRGKVSREDVAELCVALLDQPAAVNTTFEVGSTVPFSQPWTGKLLQEPVLEVALLSRQEGASVLDV